MKFWPWARSNATPGPRQQADPEVPVIIDVVPEVIDVWEPLASAPRQVSPREHVRIVVSSLQEAQQTGFIAGWFICRIYPELAWIANVVPLTKRQLEIALSVELPKQKKRLETGGLLAHYLIPDPGQPVPIKAKPAKKPDKIVPEYSKNIIAFMSKPARIPRPTARRKKGQIHAAA